MRRLRTPRPVCTALAVACLAVACLALAGCEGGSDGALAQTAVAQSPRERSLPRFEGPRIDAQGQISTDLFRRKRGVILLFSERAQGADTLAGVVAEIARDSGEHNVAFLGVSRDGNRFDARSFAARHGLSFPLVHDPAERITRKLSAPRSEAAVVVVDGAGVILLAASAQPGVERARYETAIREALRLPKAEDSVSVHLGVRPQAPAFEVRGLDDETTLTLGDLERRVVVVIFFLHTCPHCHDALKLLQEFQASVAREDLAIVPISVVDKKDAVKGMAATLSLDLPLYLDPGGAAREAYAQGPTVPETLILDRDHRVVARHGGINPRIEALLRMEILEALDAENPILLVREGYSGEETCRICHAGQHETWALTSHAYAFDTLVEHGENRNRECLPCHTVGWEEDGGYSLDRPYPHLEGVQCESCHGRGGPHQSPEFVTAGFQAVCESCHTPEHSLRFSFGERLPLVSHAANLQFASLSKEERRQLLARRDKRERQLFEHAEYVGSESCASCHEAEYRRWSDSPHARAFATLEAQGQAGSADCQRCHTTGFEQPGGFPAGGAALAGVGCESCHGPGGNHIAASARKDGTILALTDKCDSCVVLQICGSCHDDANDPGFEFELMDKIDRIRHGFRDREPPREASAE